MNGLEIKEAIDNNNKLIEGMLVPNQFTLNNIIKDLLKENEELQNKCNHEFDEYGFCIYCYRSKY